MIRTVDKIKVEYGDFQTPIELAEKVCRKLVALGVYPDVIIEPTCGVGNFIEAASKLFQLSNKIIGVEINQSYLRKLEERQIIQDKRIELKSGDFFQVNWTSMINDIDGRILVLGNFPWVTNSQQGMINGANLPNKNNFQNHNGLDAITGKSNFDISEWMLIQVVQWLQKRDAYLAMLCKASVSRKLLNYLHSNQLTISYFSTFKINAKKYGSSVLVMLK
ncbi:MAG: hypothetical protein SAL70_42055 [Scytonema sp. PMC 1070.18]|nr:hypothetical protein [Scytonema sp. PMC 1070.18]